MKIDGVDYFCFEVQRKEAEEGGMIQGHAGLLMKSSMCTQEEITGLVEDVRSRIRYAIGSFKNIRSTFPEQTKIFNHIQKDQKIIYRKTLINAFKELGVELT